MRNQTQAISSSAPSSRKMRPRIFRIPTSTIASRHAGMLELEQFYHSHVVSVAEGPLPSVERELAQRST
jgi:hypothetical protein